MRVSVKNKPRASFLSHTQTVSLLEAGLSPLLTVLSCAAMALISGLTSAYS